VRELGWPAGRAGGSALLLAPTGSGKTLLFEITSAAKPPPGGPLWEGAGRTLRAGHLGRESVAGGAGRAGAGARRPELEEDQALR